MTIMKAHLRISDKHAALEVQVLTLVFFNLKSTQKNLNRY